MRIHYLRNTSCTFILWAMPVAIGGCSGSSTSAGSTNTTTNSATAPVLTFTMPPAPRPAKKPQAQAAPKRFVVRYDAALARRYTIAKAEDSSMDGIKRKTYRVSVPANIKERQVRPTAERIISRLIRQDNDLDEISLFLYGDSGVASGPYTVASVDWAPNGEWGSTTEEIARTNDRSGYAVSVDLKEDFETALSQPTEQPQEKLGMSQERRREAFKALYAAQEKAQAEADAAYPPEGDAHTNITQGRTLKERYTREVRERYGLSEENADKIMEEGSEAEWILE